MPSWDFTPGDKFYVADFNGDGKKDLFVYNGVQLGDPVRRDAPLDGTGFQLVARYDGELPRLADDGRRPALRRRLQRRREGGPLGLQRLQLVDPVPRDAATRPATRSAMSHRYDGSFPGWQMTRRRQALRRRLQRRREGRPLRLQRDELVDRLPRDAPLDGQRARDAATLRRQRARLADAGARPALDLGDINMDGKADLFVYNHQDWSNGVPRDDDLERHRPRRARGKRTGSASGTSARSTSSSRATSRASAAGAT